MRLILACVLCSILMLPSTGRAEDVGPYLQSISVNVLAAGGNYSDGKQGSGTLVVCEVGGEQTTWIVTAHHVVSSLRQVKDVIDANGDERKSIRYRDAQIIQEQTESGRGVGEIKYDAKIISVDPRRDTALLRVRKQHFTDATARFYLDDDLLVPGTKLYHCGAPGGKQIGGTCSLTSGIVSRIGVRIPDFGGAEHGVYDQVTCSGLGGSSGGLVALESDGRWVGMITLGLRGADSFHWIVPVRSLRAWLEEIDALWLIDPSVSRPSEKDIEAIPLELNPAGYSGKADTDRPTPASEDIERMLLIQQ